MVRRYLEGQLGSGFHVKVWLQRKCLVRNDVLKMHCSGWNEKSHEQLSREGSLADAVMG